MKKRSEDFHVDLNSPYLRQMVPSPSDCTDSGPHPLSEMATQATVVRNDSDIVVHVYLLVSPLTFINPMFLQGVFSVTCPHKNVYLVATLEKVLQAGIDTVTEPYKKAESAKVQYLVLYSF